MINGRASDLLTARESLVPNDDIIELKAKHIVLNNPINVLKFTPYLYSL
jgi:hypothetical protein